MFLTTKEAQKLEHAARQAADLERQQYEQREQLARKANADRERRARPEHVAAYKLLSAALDDTGLRWISEKEHTYKFHSPALSADIYLTYVRKCAVYAEYRVSFNDSVEVVLEGSDPAGQLAEKLHKKGIYDAWNITKTERARREQILFDLAARVKS